MPFTIAAFWKNRLSTSTRAGGASVKGWQHIVAGPRSFLEAPMRRADGFGTADPGEASVLLVSAPGAVGKSTFAKQLAFETGALLIDLAETGRVGANFVVGGLAKTGLYESFLAGSTALVIDGIDEARIALTQASMSDFLKDVVEVAAPTRKPIVLLGRTGAIEEAWLLLQGQGIEAPVLEIDYYDLPNALEFAKLQAQEFRKEFHRREPDGRAIELILDRLKEHTQADGNAFVGYAPVLIAIARQVADPDDPRDENTQALITRIKGGSSVITLETITDSILAREKGKLSRLSFEDPTLRERLYGPKEQIERLVTRLYKFDKKSDLPSMSPKDQETYSNALETWVAEHPFLDGSGATPSSAVFGGLLAAAALRDPNCSAIAIKAELGRGTKINPFLAQFYAASLDVDLIVPAEHIGLVYASARARLSVGENANLSIDAEAEEGDETLGEAALADVEITRSNRDDIALDVLRVKADSAGEFLLGKQVADVDINAPMARVRVGDGIEAIFGPPVWIEVGEIIIEADRFVVEELTSRHSTNAEAVAVIHLQTPNLIAPKMSSRPICSASIKLELDWPGAKSYPWTDFAAPVTAGANPQLAEALRRLKRILRLFRSHKRSQLRKYRDAVDHNRRTKGSGRKVRDQLLAEAVLTSEGNMYFLDPDRLASQVGLNFHDVRTTRATDATMAFLERALSRPS